MKMDSLEKLAKVRLKRTIATLYKLINDEKVHLDIILAGGNSGIMCAHIAHIFYNHIAQQPPEIIRIPFVRYKPNKKEIPQNRWDNSILKYAVKNQIKEHNIESFKNILFIDTEIGTGTTSENCLKLLLEVIEYREKQELTYYIIAENFDFELFETPSNIKVHFRPPAQGIEGLYEVVTNILPEKTERLMREVFPKPPYEKQHLINVLMDLPSRSKENPLEGFNLKNNYVAQKRIDNLKTLKGQFNKNLASLIEEAVEEYKEGKIDLSNENYLGDFGR
ncbi:hypothetical protein GF360_01110 [candidate division WWE3 bacterium]|nr:hypothetical protein [candidate division WWE3 bacterium]